MSDRSAGTPLRPLALDRGVRPAGHSHVRHAAKDRGFTVVHIFRYAQGKAVELRDVGMALSANSPNADRAF